MKLENLPFADQHVQPEITAKRFRSTARGCRVLAATPGCGPVNDLYPERVSGPPQPLRGRNAISRPKPRVSLRLRRRDLTPGCITERFQRATAGEARVKLEIRPFADQHVQGRKGNRKRVASFLANRQTAWVACRHGAKHRVGMASPDCTCRPTAAPCDSMPPNARKSCQILYLRPMAGATKAW